MVARKQSAFGGYNMSTGVKAHVAGSCGCKAGWFQDAAWQVGLVAFQVQGVFPSSLAGWFKVAVQARCWFVGLRCCSRWHDASIRKQSAFGGGLQHVGSAAAKQVGVRWLASCWLSGARFRHLMHGGTQTIRFWGLQHVPLV